MRGSGNQESVATDEDTTFQVIVLGSTGGPREDIVTGLLARSTATKWSKDSVVAVDGGTLLAGISRIFERDMPDLGENEQSKGGKAVMAQGPFAGLELPNLTTHANAAHVFRNLIASVLVTHPHLDHVSGLAMNTPLVEAESGPKAVAALPSTIAALRNHIFNDITWPNLSDEDGGAGLITYQRLVDGGNPRLGRGEGRGYVKACEGIITKCLSISHGRCGQRYNPDTGKHHRAESTVFATESFFLPSRRVSIDTQEPSSYTPTTQHLSVNSNRNTPTALATVESSAFFLRETHTGTEIIIFGDMEPDSISLEPRNEKIWDAAAPKIVSGTLRAIFVECSFPDSVDDNSLYGHLCPRHLIAELKVLAGKVLDAHKPHNVAREMRKRKRWGSDIIAHDSRGSVSPKSQPPQQSTSPSPSRRRATRRTASRHEDDMSSRTVGETTPPPPSSGPHITHDDNNHHQQHHNPDNTPTERRSSNANSGMQLCLSLSTLKVFIIHIKESFTDGPHPRDQILKELRKQAEDAGLGCEFYAPLSGEAVFV
ncbi:hypothetical protein AJ80_00077 [Polytolypa hystricis UAMH7299]|uniref:3',5'-cyclic-nucleotide phosphodiesterase n=1 Tax=Polytolypa hystricis (strain UAMH7299) TaxID=1447883 RepID=A0A2B7Z5R0_POLH7|nr:hypothetical protein AJ80_00077 [Polytolypa hystricis UAMH7299]